MDGFAEKTNVIAVPKNTGIEGFLKTLRGILGLSHVQSINIDATGKVNYTRYVRDGESDGPIAVDYTGLEPWSIIRNGDIEEIVLPLDTPAPSVIASMFNRIAQDSLVPVAFATGADSSFWSWHERTARMRLTRRGLVYGLPLYTDRQIPDHSLVLCAAYVRGNLVDCHRFLMTGMNEADFIPPETMVDVI